MTSTVLYYNRGHKCYPQLLTSIFSLRDKYSGSITLMQEGILDDIVARLLSEMSVTLQYIQGSSDSILETKSSLWQYLNVDCAVMLDSDTIVLSAIDEFVEWIKEWGFVASWFNGWLTTEPRVQTRIEEWQGVVPALIPGALAYGKAINSGVQGWSKSAAILPQYMSLTRIGTAAGCNPNVVDEIALQLLLPVHRHYLAHHVWNTSGAYGEITAARIVHYHGFRHRPTTNPRFALWMHWFRSLQSAFPEYSQRLSQMRGDKGEYAT